MDWWLSYFKYFSVCSFDYFSMRIVIISIFSVCSILSSVYDSGRAFIDFTYTSVYLPRRFTLF